MTKLRRPQKFVTPSEYFLGMEKINNLAKELIKFEYEYAHDQMLEWEHKLKDLSPDEIEPDFHLYEEAYRYGVFDALITVMDIIETMEEEK